MANEFIKARGDEVDQKLLVKLLAMVQNFEDGLVGRELEKRTLKGWIETAPNLYIV